MWPMRQSAGILVVASASLLAAVPVGRGGGDPVASLRVPGGDAGIGFDDFRFAPGIGKLLAPAGRAGTLALVDPATRGVALVEGFSVKKEFDGGHDEGVTSADEGDRWIFATDRTSRTLAVVDPRARKIVSSVKLSGPPDYVRFVRATREVWVTEPDEQRVEIFRLASGEPPAPAHDGFVPVPGGPESLVVDTGRGRAYTHLWKGRTAAIDVRARAVLGTWDNGCEGSRGIALDERRNLLFAGCAEGKAVVLDAGKGKILSSLSAGGGVDVIDYDAALAHLYLPGARSATMAILAVSPKGELSLLGTLRTAPAAHCVATDGKRNVFVCDPRKGSLLLFHDDYP